MPGLEVLLLEGVTVWSRKPQTRTVVVSQGIQPSYASFPPQAEVALPRLAAAKRTFRSDTTDSLDYLLIIRDHHSLNVAGNGHA